MKTRKEISGLHMFDRNSGIHILFDEVSFPPPNGSISPRTVSIALTNVCDLHCHFCYAPKNRETLPIDFLKSLCAALDNLDVLEVTFGGGEPLLYPEFIEACQWIWNNTSLSISVTTHGHHLTPEMIRRLDGHISSIRFSVDGVEPYYSEIRGKPLSRLLPIISSVHKVIPTALNTVVSSGRVGEAERVIRLAMNLGLDNLLLIPEHLHGQFLFTPQDWECFEALISKYADYLQLNITQESSIFVRANCLATEQDSEFVFAHISADRVLKRNSYAEGGVLITDINALAEHFLQIRQTL